MPGARRRPCAAQLRARRAGPLDGPDARPTFGRGGRFRPTTDDRARRSFDGLDGPSLLDGGRWTAHRFDGPLIPWRLTWRERSDRAAGPMPSKRRAAERRIEAVRRAGSTARSRWRGRARGRDARSPGAAEGAGGFGWPSTAHGSDSEPLQNTLTRMGGQANELVGERHWEQCRIVHIAAQPVDARQDDVEATEISLRGRCYCCCGGDSCYMGSAPRCTIDHLAAVIIASAVDIGCVLVLAEDVPIYVVVIEDQRRSGWNSRLNLARMVDKSASLLKSNQMYLG
jgi:hypothetical protein